MRENNSLSFSTNYFRVFIETSRVFFPFQRSVNHENPIKISWFNNWISRWSRMPYVAKTYNCTCSFEIWFKCWNAFLLIILWQYRSMYFCNAQRLHSNNTKIILSNVYIRKFLMEPVLFSMSKVKFFSQKISAKWACFLITD